MPRKFDWYTGADLDFEPEVEEEAWALPDGAAWGFWLAAILVTGIVLGSWYAGRQRIEESEAAWQTAVQQVLDLQHEAVRSGDADLFFSLLDGDAAWRAAQLLPYNRMVHEAEAQVTQVRRIGSLWGANVAWDGGSGARQRLLFFRQVDGRWLQTDSAPDFWEATLSQSAAWGMLTLYAADEQWAAEMTGFVSRIVDEVCDAACQSEKLPLRLVVTDRYGLTAVPGVVQIPSPRLLALDGDGRPAPLFWQLLEQRVTDVLAPAHIRFALPPPNFLGLQTVDYERAAAAFMAENPDMTVELVTLEEIPTAAAWPADLDGGAFPPSAGMIAAGRVRDLTPLVQSDPDFDQGDFYEQVWQGAWWQDRMWLMPQAAALKVLFYEKAAYREAGVPEPPLLWTWTRLERDFNRLSPPADGWAPPARRYVFLDTGRDMLFSRAFHQDRLCRDTAVADCRPELQTEEIAAALNWYAAVVNAGHMPNTAALTPTERSDGRIRWQASIWVDEPVFYEHAAVQTPVGVRPFPGFGQRAGVTPLWVQGSFISQSSERPLAMWRWLKFLSYQGPLPRYRLVPARPSVANRSGYWFRLPPTLSLAMREGFIAGRAVTPAERALFEWEEMAAVVSGKGVSEVVGERPLALPWFGADP